jgi:hypothetical protein
MHKPAPPDDRRHDENPLYAILEGLAQCARHRRWYASFAMPYLGSHPIEIGSGLGDYAAEWLPHVERITVTDSDPLWVEWLKNRYADNDRIAVHQLILPAAQNGSHSSVIAYNVLEHIRDHDQALRSMMRLANPGSYIVLICPAFPFAMSRLDVSTGHFRRYTRHSLTRLLASVDLKVISVRYINLLGLIGYYITTTIFRRSISSGRLLGIYDRIAVPISRRLENILNETPFGQSVVAVAQIEEFGPSPS